MDLELSPSTLPPAQPTYVLRGHTSQIHAVHFLRQNLRLLTGDADGWVVLWNVPIKRPAAVWRAHKETILGLGTWGDGRIVTHGRDNRLCVWQLRPEDEGNFSTTLPNDEAVVERKEPWLLHSLTVNTMNFCSFAMSPYNAPDSPPKSKDSHDQIVIATPALQDGFINLTLLPSESRLATIPPPTTSTGLLMAVAIHQPARQTPSQHLPTVIAGYESGHTAIHTPTPTTTNTSSAQAKYTTPTATQAHTQPVLSLAPHPHTNHFYTSSADALLTRQNLPPSAPGEVKVAQTRHAGQQSLRVRGDGKVFATAGWDGRARVYAAGPGMREVAVLKWHREGTYAVGFGEVYEGEGDKGLGGQADVGKWDAGKALTVAEQREEKARTTHWLAVGGKDGKVSLWDIY